MTEILRTNSLTRAVTLQTALQAAGIEAAVQGEHALGIVGGGVSVVVIDDRTVERARIILREIDAIPDSLPQLHKALPEIGREYQRRWVRHLWIHSIAVVYIVAVMATPGLSTPVRAVLILSGAALFGHIAVRNWRCPNCNCYFGRSMWHARCPECHVSFRSDGGVAA